MASAFGKWTGREEKSTWQQTVEKAQSYLDAGEHDHEHEKSTELLEGDREKALALAQSEMAQSLFSEEDVMSLELTIGTEGDIDNGGWPTGITLAAKMAAQLFLQNIHEKQEVEKSIKRLSDRLSQQSDAEASAMVVKVGTAEDLVKAVRSVRDDIQKKKADGQETGA